MREREYWPPDEDDEERWPGVEVEPVVAAGSLPTGRPIKLRYGEMYRYVFNSPNWGTNLLAGAVCQLVPVVGPLVFIGYGYEVIEALHRWGGRRYPDFNTNRLMPYLMRGLWPFLVALIIGLIVGLLVALLIGAGVGILFAVAGRSRSPGIVLAFVAVMVVVLMAMGLVVQLLATPLMLRAGFKQELDFSNASGFVREFLGRTWKEALLGALFMMFTGLGVYLVGFLLCYIGQFPAVALAQLAHQHLLFQLYQIYLTRGGTPIPFKREEGQPEPLP